mmetsp:Transcript_26554/g.62397  ORF Transcript_26554/g.62397 Transcript_26554/m.62397 type:complete len:94 (-) Transcript_26554:14-295(-)
MHRMLSLYGKSSEQSREKLKVMSKGTKNQMEHYTRTSCCDVQAKCHKNTGQFCATQRELGCISQVPVISQCHDLVYCLFQIEHSTRLLLLVAI